MSKKSFKQLQNRLYREIKRRIQAESMPKIHNRIGVTHRPIDRLAYTTSMPLCGVDEQETQEIAKYLVKTEIAKTLANELITNQYVKYENYVEPDAYGQDILYVRCSIDVCKPMRGEEMDANNQMVHGTYHRGILQDGRDRIWNVCF